jgi:hypothetical protein
VIKVSNDIMSMTAPTSKTILIGDLLVRSEMTSPRDMADAVPISLKSNLPIGRVLIAAGALTPGHLQQALVAQSLVRDSLLSADLAVQALRIVVRESFDLEQALNIVGWHPDSFTSENRLGQLLLLAGCITQAQLDECLRIFYSAGLPLARVLVLKGVISNLVAYVALTSQQMLRENKLSREQAIQSVQAAKASRGIIESDYIDGYLRLQPTHNIRLGELFVRADIVGEDTLLSAVENAIKQGVTLGETLIEQGVINEQTLNRALEAQRLVTEGHLDIGKAGDVLRAAEHKRTTIKDMMIKLNIASGIKDGTAQPASKVDLPKTIATKFKFEFQGGKERTPENEWHITGPIGEHVDGPAQPAVVDTVDTSILPEVAELIKKGLFPLPQGQAPTNKKRSGEETKAREVVARLQAKLEALNTRNDYLANMIESHMPSVRITRDTTCESPETVSDFESAMEFIERLFGLVETSAYRNGYLLSRVDSVSEAGSADKVKATETQLEEAVKRLAAMERKWHESDTKLRQTLERLTEAEQRLRKSANSIAGACGSNQAVHGLAEVLDAVRTGEMPAFCDKPNSAQGKTDPLLAFTLPMTEPNASATKSAQTLNAIIDAQEEDAARKAQMRTKLRPKKPR